MVSSCRILVVNSNEQRLEEFRQLLAVTQHEQQPCQIDSISQGRDALRLVVAAANAGQPYAVIFMAARLTAGWNGIEAVRRIWDKYPHTEVVLCTDSTDREWDTLIANMAALDCLPVVRYPFAGDSIAELASQLIQKWNRGEQATAYTRQLHNEIQARTQQLQELIDAVDRHAAELLLSGNGPDMTGMHDPLTKLPTRMLLQDRLRQCIELARRDNRSFAFAVMNVDRFKEINDIHGHLAGDRVLQEISARLLEQLRTSDTVARLGGDEFALILHGADRESIVPVINKINHAIEEPISFDSLSLLVACSIGLTYYPEHGEDAETLLKHAEAAMRQAREAALNIKIFDAAEHGKLSDQFMLVKDLEAAVKQQALQLNFQPIIDLHTGSVYSMEALCRWIHPTRGFVPPDRFIALAEQKGLIKPLTDSVLNQGLQQTASWHQSGIKIRVSINLSVRNFMDPQLPDVLAELINHHDFEPQYLTLEITESMMMTDPERALKIARRFSEMGIDLSLDDFGSGYSSLAYLKRLPVKELKIDRSFIQHLDNDPESRVIVKSTIDMAHNLGLRVVAEGVENAATLDLLQALGCDRVQGYFICKPNFSAEISRWLNESNWKLLRYGT